MNADGQETLIKEIGFTSDIVDAVESVFRKYSWQVDELLPLFSTGDGDIDTEIQNVVDYVDEHIIYQIDPAGKQWIRTPARFIKDGRGDCKSYSIFICSVFDRLGYNTAFRFASYSRSGEFTHVYPIIFDSLNHPHIVDMVAEIQVKTPIGDEYKYKTKKDIMNESTRISMLSGIGGDSDMTADDKINLNRAFLASVMLKANAQLRMNDGDPDALQDKCIAETAIAAMDKYGIVKADKLALLGKVMAYYCAKQQLTTKNVLDAFARFDGMQKDGVDLVVTSAVTSNDDYKSFISWWDAYITNYNYCKQNCVGTESASKDIYNNAAFFLYCCVSDNLLSKKAIAKKRNQETILREIADKINSNYPTLLNIVTAGIMDNFGYTPLDMIQEIKKSSKKVSIGDTTTDGNKTDTAGKVDEWGKLITGTASSIVDIINKFKSGSSTSSGTTTSTVISSAASTSDWSTNIMTFLPMALLGVGFAYIIFNKKSKRR